MQNANTIQNGQNQQNPQNAVSTNLQNPQQQQAINEISRQNQVVANNLPVTQQNLQNPQNNIQQRTAQPNNLNNQQQQLAQQRTAQIAQNNLQPNTLNNQNGQQQNNFPPQNAKQQQLVQQFGQQNQQNNFNKTLASRQSKASATGPQPTNTLQQQPVIVNNPQPIPQQNIPVHTLQSRQSKLSLNQQPINQQQQPPVVPMNRPNRPVTGRQSKLSIVDQEIVAPQQIQQPRQQIRPQPRQQDRQPLPGSRQSKLSIDAEIPPRPPRASSQRSMRIGGQRPPRSVRRQNISTVVSGRVAPNFQTRNRHFTPNSRGRVLTASTDALSTYSNYETLEFFPLVVGHEEPEIFSEGLQYDGWMSEADARYPIDVILGFEHISDVYKIYLTVADHLVPSKVEILVGKGRNRKEDEEPTYLTARKAAFELKATMRFDKRRTDMEERETKVGFIDSECQYLWLLFYAPYPSSLNQTNQIRISGLTVEGYVIEPKKHRHSRSVDSFRGSSMSERRPTRRRRRSREETPERSPTRRRERSREETPERRPTRARRRRRSRELTPISLLSETRSLAGDSQSGRVSRISSILGSSVSDGDGWRSNGENLAADPLMAIRLVRNLLRKKRKRSLKRGRDVEATVCQRAIETLNGYEKQMTEIRSKMSEALQQENVEEAKKQELALIDCRDTAFRVIHLDLLLEKTELRAIGVQSKWSDSMSLR